MTTSCPGRQLLMEIAADEASKPPGMQIRTTPSPFTPTQEPSGRASGQDYNIGRRRPTFIQRPGSAVQVLAKRIGLKVDGAGHRWRGGPPRNGPG